MKDKQATVIHGKDHRVQITVAHTRAGRTFNVAVVHKGRHQYMPYSKGYEAYYGEDAAAALRAAEQYVGRPITSSDIKVRMRRHFGMAS